MPNAIDLPRVLINGAAASVTCPRLSPNRIHKLLGSSPFVVYHLNSWVASHIAELCKC